MSDNEPRCSTCGLPTHPDYGDPHECPSGFLTGSPSVPTTQGERDGRTMHIFCPLTARYRRWRNHQPFWREDKTARMLGVACFGCRRCGRGATEERDAVGLRVGALPPYKVSHIGPAVVPGTTEQWFVMGTVDGDPRNPQGPIAICEYEPSAHTIAALLNATGGAARRAATP